MSARNRNDGLRKVCDCPRRAWPKCAHPWHFNYKWAGTHYRFSLDEQVGKHLDSKTLAETQAEGIRVAIRDGVFVRMKRGRTIAGSDPRPALAQLTIAQLLATFETRYLAQRPDTLEDNQTQIGIITRTPLARTDGRVLPFGEWLVSDVSSDTLERFKELRSVATIELATTDHPKRRRGGLVTANRNLSLLKSAFNWAVRTGYVPATPFKRGTETVVALAREVARSRRLEAGEVERLVAACQPHLRALVEAAIETGCRKGELLSLQWHQVRTGDRPELVLPARKTKTKTARTLPVSTRLKAILDMRRLDPAGEALPDDAYVFGNEIGQRVGSIKTAWRRTLTRANLADLHFHDLRREAGSRWLEGGVPLHTIQKWLGHANISQTSTYLATTFHTQHDAMRAFEERARLQRIATEAGKGHHGQAQLDSEPNARTQQNTERHEPHTTVN